jgi:hypothetical protein
MIDVFLDVSGYIKVVAVCMVLGAFLWLLLRRFSTISIIVWMIVISIGSVIPLVIALVVEAPERFLLPRGERLNTIEVRLFASLAEQPPYSRDRPRAPNDDRIMPNHLSDADEVGRISIRYMKEVAKGEDGCLSILITLEALTETISTTARINGTSLAYISSCRSLPQPSPAYRVIAPAVGKVSAEAELLRLPEFLKSREKPWQAQISVNRHPLTEDDRGVESWRNVRSAPFLQIITLREGRTTLSGDSFSLDL